MTTTLIPAVASWFLTYGVHSTILLTAAWLLARTVVRRESLRETLWKTALVGGLATTTIAVALPRPGAFRMELAALSASGSPVVGVESQAGPPGGLGQEEAAGSDASHDPSFRPEPESDPGPETTRGLEGGAAPESDAPDRGAADGSDGAAAPAVAADRNDGSGAGSRTAVTVALILWLVVALALLVRLVYRHTRLRLLLRDREQVSGVESAPSVLTELRRTAGVWKPVRLTSSPSVATPLALGNVEICVPERFLGELNEAEQRAALAHELAHLARRDPVWQVVGSVLGAVFFFQPLNALARREIRAAAEYLADGWAVRNGGSQVELARCLANVAGWVAPAAEPVLAGTVAMAEGGSPLLVRVQRLLEHEPEQAAQPGVRVAVAGLVLALTAGFGPAFGATTTAGPGSDPGSRLAPGAPGSGDTVPSSVLGGTLEMGRDTARMTPAGPVFAPDTAEISDTDSDSGRNSNRSTNSNSNTDNGVTTRTRSVTTSESDGDIPPSRAETSLAGQELSVVRAPATGDLADRLAWSRDRASGSGPYWVAWAVPSVLRNGSYVSMDSRRGMNLHLTDAGVAEWGPGAVASKLGVANELSGRGSRSDVVVMALMARGGAGERIDRLAMSSPQLSMNLNGPVYWLGEVDASDGVRWMAGTYRTADTRRVAVRALDAAALHDTPAAGSLLRSVIEDGMAGRDAREQAIEGLAYHPTDEYLDLLIRIADEDRDLLMREEATQTLGEMRHPRAEEELRSLLKSAEPRVREEALDALSDQKQDTALVAILVEVAMNDPDPDLRRDAVEQMGDLPAALAVTALTRLLGQTSDPAVMEEIAETLGDVGTPAALEALDSLIARAPTEDVMRQAIEAIGDGFSAELAAPRLQALVDGASSSDIRSEALEALTGLGTASTVGGAALLDVALHDDDPDLRRDAVEMIADLPADQAVPLLRRVAFESGDGTAERQAAESLGDVATPEALAVLDEILEKNPSEDASFQAVESIAENFSRDLAIPRLRRVLQEHPSSRVRREALDQLADLGG